MRYLLCALFFIASQSYAQKFEIGINGGANPFTHVNKSGRKSNEKSIVGYAASIKAFIAIRSWQLGVGVEVANPKKMGEYGIFDYAQNKSIIKEIPTSYGSPAINYVIYINDKIKFNKGYLYPGFAIGGISILKGEDNFDYEYRPGTANPVIVGDKASEAANSGVLLGAQFGAVINIAKHLGINAEIAARYGLMGKTKLFYLPVTAGIRYSF